MRTILLLAVLAWTLTGAAQSSDRCGFEQKQQEIFQQDPHKLQQYQHLLENVYPTLSQSTDRSFNTIVIPTVVHVIHNGEAVGTGANISDAQVQAQIDVMNQDFSAQDPDFGNTPAQFTGAIGSADIQFCLAQIAPDGSASTGIVRHNIPVTGSDSDNNNIESQIKPQTNWDPTQYFNVYVLGIPGTSANGGVLGYAYLPFNGSVGATNDGVVCDYRWFGGPGFSQSGDKTMTHEAGHYLGLPHTFDGNSCNQDDGITDTPNISSPTADLQFMNCNNGFPASGPSSCGNAHMYVNYMDYNQENCYTSFTNGQIAVMRAVLEGTSTVPGFTDRVALVNNATSCNLAAVDGALLDVVSPGGTLCAGTPVTPQVTLRNLGSNNLTSATISYSLSTGGSGTTNWTGNLSTGQTETVSLTAFTPSGSGAATFTATLTLSGDANAGNNTASTNVTIVAETPLPLSEDVEGDSGFPLAGSSIGSVNPSGDSFVWAVENGTSGFGTGNSSLVFDNYNGSGNSNPGGTFDALVTPIYDLNGATNTQLTFDVAYARYDNQFTDTLRVLLVQDCGPTYDVTIYSKGGSTLATAPDDTNEFTPTANQWRTETIDLSSYDGADNISLAFVNISGWGNRVFVDNINLSSAGACVVSGSVSSTDASCANTTDGSVTFSTNPANNYSYQWSNGATTPTVFNVAPGTYSVTVGNGPGCSSIYTTTVDAPDAIAVQTSGQDETALGANNGSASVSVSGGTGSLNVLWSNGATTTTISNLAPGTYNVTVTDQNNCQETGSFTVNAYVCPGISGGVTDGAVLCAGDANGSLSVQASGGSGGNFTYQWSNNATTPTIDNLAPGNYTVTVFDVDGCSQSFDGTVSEPAAIDLTATATDETANGANNGTATASATGGTGNLTYAWSNGQSGPSISNLAPGAYTVTATDQNQCFAIEVVTVGEFACGSISGQVPTGSVLCFGDANGSLTAFVTGTNGSVSYQWSNGGNGQTIQNLTAGNYTVTATDGDGCSTVLSGQVLQPTQLSVGATATDVTTNGGANGTATASGTGGTGTLTYQWSNGGSSSTLQNLSPGTYFVTVTDQNGCIATASATVNGFQCSGIAANVADSFVDCAGDANGSLTAFVNGGNGPFTYQWSNGLSGQTIGGLAPGAYTVTVLDNDDCPAVATATVNAPAAIVGNATATDESSNGGANGTATVSASGGTGNLTYLWNTGATTSTITGLAPGSYSVTVFDANQCSEVFSTTVGAFQCGSISGVVINDSVTCFGDADGSLSAQVNGGNAPLTYQWSNGATGPAIGNLAPGAYTVTVLDNDACSVVLSGAVSQPSAVNVSVSSTDVTANGATDGTASAAGSGGTGALTYAWSNGMSGTTITGLVPGTYTVTTTDQNGCTSTGSVTVNAFACGGFSATVSDGQVTCAGDADGSLTALSSGGAGTITYQWSNGMGGQTISGLAPGDYSVTLTDADGCPSVATATVSEPAALTLDVTTTDETANGANNGSATASAGGGTGALTYQWTTGATGTTISGLIPGGYAVTVTDANGCQIVEQFTINGFLCPPLSGSVDATSTTCADTADGTLTAQPTGGAGGWNYLWNDGTTTQTNDNLGAGDYSVTATDGNGCSVVLNGTVTSPAALTATTSATDESDVNAADGTATVSATGGTGTLTYLWSNGQTTATATNLNAGMYSVTITDANGCTTVATTTVGGLNCGSVSGAIAGNMVSCVGASDGFLTATVTGTNGSVSYLWSNDATTATVQGLPAGSYSVTITVDDLDDCSLVLNGTVAAPPALQLTATGTDETAAGANDGTATAAGSGGTGNLTYAWNTGDTGPTISNLAPGTYEVTATDANGCTETTTATVNAFGCNFAVSASSTDANCDGAPTGSATANVPGSPDEYTYLWSNGATTQTVDNLPAGTYSVTVTDGFNCAATATTTIAAEDDAQPQVVTNDVTLYLDANGMAQLPIGQADGGSTDNCPGALLFDLNETAYDCDDLGANTNTLTVTDAAGNAAAAPLTVTVLDTLAPVLTDCPADVTTSGCDPVDYVIAATDNCGEVTYELLSGLTSGSVFPEGETTVMIAARDASGNETICSFTVTSTNTLEVAPVVTLPSCPGFPDGSVELVIQGGNPPYTVDWGGVDPDNLPPGAYTFTITDAAGCMVGGNLIIDGPPALVIEVDGITPSEPGQATGAVAITVSGGTPAPSGDAYSYIWRTSGVVVSNNEDPTGLPAGDYTVQVIDANGCAVTSVIITIPQTTSTLEAELGAFVRVQPNPTMGLAFVSFELPETVVVRLSVLDVTGKRVYALPERPVRAAQLRLPLYEVAAGVYFVRVETARGALVRRLVVL